MSQLAIKGHATCGKEVIKILEMLGGINTHNLYGDENYSYYTIDNDKEIKGGIYVFGDEELLSFTLEEFLEKFPYKVGDKVIIEKYYGQIFEILSARWCNERNIIMYQTSNGWYCANKLKFYKEETMEEIIKIDIPKGYEFTGVDDDAQQVVFTKIQPEYPKTYEECCEILGIRSDWHLTLELDTPAMHDLSVTKEFDYVIKLESLRKLSICRDAYWKIAGEQMGLGKPWNQDYNDRCFVIANNNGNIHTYEYHGNDNVILAFPTAEMRDAFFLGSEEIAQLISSCKEFL